MRSEELTPRERYSRELLSHVPDELEPIEADLREQGKFGVQLGRLEGALVALLTKIHRPQRVVEVGSLYGASAAWILSALPEGGVLWALELDDHNIQRIETHLKSHISSGRLKILAGDARQSLGKLPLDKVDMVFIDANKAAYVDYLDWAEERLSPGGLLVADNTYLFGEVCLEAPRKTPPKAWAAMRLFNQRLADRRVWRSVLFPTPEGLSIAIRK